MAGSEDLGDAEIAEERVSEGVEEDIAGLDVAVDVPLGVDVVERLGDRSEPAGEVSGIGKGAAGRPARRGVDPRDFPPPGIA